MKKPFAGFALIAGGTVTLLVLVADLYQYGWAGQRQSATLTAWLVKHVVLAVLAALSFASLRWRSAVKVAVAVLCVSLAAGLYTADAVLAGPNSALAASRPSWSVLRPVHYDATIDQDSGATLAGGFGVTIDASDRVELLTDSHKRHIDVVPAILIGPIVSGENSVRSRKAMNAGDLMPLGGISSTLTVLCNDSGRYVTYESDEYGFRNPKGIWDSAGADIAVVGQSFAQGYCVPDGASFVDLLRAHYPVTLNLGMSGQSSLLQLAAIKEYLPRYAPKIVLWVYQEGMDAVDLHDEATDPLLMRYLEPTFSQHLLTRQPEIDTALRRVVADNEMREREAKAAAKGSSFVDTSLAFIKLWHLRHEVALRSELNSHNEVTQSVLGQMPDNLFSDVLTQARTATYSWGGTLYFVYLPSWRRYKDSPAASDREHTMVLNLVRAQGIPVIDVEPSFHAQTDPLSLFPFRRFGHYNEKGNRIVAKTVLMSLSADEEDAETNDTGHSLKVSHGPKNGRQVSLP